MNESGKDSQGVSKRQGRAPGELSRLVRAIRWAPSVLALALSVALIGACGDSIYPRVSDSATATPTITTSPTTGNFLYSSNFGDGKIGRFTRNLGSQTFTFNGATAAGAINGSTGIGLVEVYDMDTYTPFTTMKLTNVSTRADVGTGNNVLIGGFEINGTAPKRLLIRGAGPSLSAMNVSGVLAAPHLELFNSSGGTIRENYAWQTGNDPGLVSEAESSTGAFAFGNGSADSAILIVLPPGTYTAEVSGVNQSSGVALVEVYEVP